MDLDIVDPTFTVFVGDVVVRKLGQRCITPKEVSPDKSPCDQFFIEPISNAEGYRIRNEFWDRGGNLVSLGVGARVAGCYAPVVKSNLNLENDSQDIMKYEMTNMWGDSNIKNRLLMKKEKDINIDQYKFFIFPGLLKKMKLSASDFD